MLCAAGLDHQQLKTNDAVWALLARVEDQYFPPFGGFPAERFEQRNCACGSTLARRAATNLPPSSYAFGSIDEAVRAACGEAA
jgi:hypothetical protein